MLISKSQSDEAVLREIGARMARRRLDFQLTQADLAEQAGVSKRTVERIEAGAFIVPQEIRDTFQRDFFHHCWTQ